MAHVAHGGAISLHGCYTRLIERLRVRVGVLDFRNGDRPNQAFPAVDGEDRAGTILRPGKGLTCGVEIDRQDMNQRRSHRRAPDDIHLGTIVAEKIQPAIRTDRTARGGIRRHACGNSRREQPSASAAPTLDGTFGPQVVFFRAPPPGMVNLSPYSGLQFFGEVNIDAQTLQMTVDLRDINGVSVFSKTLQPRL
jgi:hypothetical protein